jgi:hypothetical protein
VNANQSGPLGTATAVVGLLAGVVAGLYVLGGVTLGLRLLFAGFSIESIVVLIGQLPQTLVVTASLVSVGAPLVLVGIGAAVFLAASNRPKSTPEAKPLTRVTQYLLVVLSVVLVAPAIAVALDNYYLSYWFLTSLIGFGATGLVVFRAWYGLRQVGARGGSRADRALLGTVLCMAMALVPAIMFGAALRFDEARACTNEPDGEERGAFLGQTSDQVFLAIDAGDVQKIVSVPAGRVTLLTYGDSPDARRCPASEDASGQRAS